MSKLKYYDGITWKTVNGQVTGDTLPIGSEVDFIGETVPAGWEQVSNYSTNEINTGETWTNGKPIYRKVVTLVGDTSTQNFPVSDIASNIDNIWINASKSRYGTGLLSGLISDWDIENARFSAVIDSGTVYYKCQSLSYKNATIVFEYTKSTD